MAFVPRLLVDREADDPTFSLWVPQAASQAPLTAWQFFWLFSILSAGSQQRHFPFLLF